MIHQRRPLITLILIVLSGFLFTSNFPTPARADSSRELQLAVHQLTVYLGTDSNAQHWRQFLELNKLETQAAKGDAADIQALASVLKKLNSDTPGLSQPAFQDVKYAIQRQISNLATRDSIDVLDAVAERRSNLTPIPLAEIEYRRDRAVYDLQTLRERYQNMLGDDDRQQIFETLKLDSLIALLQDMEIEVPNFRTAELIQQEIETAQLGLAEIDKQLSQLNQQMDQIQKWMEELRKNQSNKPGEGPVPDDSDAGSTPKKTSPQKQDPVSPPVTQQDKQKLALVLKTLETTKRQLLKTIDELKQELKNLQPNEQARMQRRAGLGRALSPYQRSFDELQLEQRDIYFAAANYSFSRFRRVFANGTNPRIQNAIEANLATLLKYFGDLSDPKNRKAQAEIGKALGELDSTVQASALVAAIRKEHSLPNLEVSVSGQLINQLAGRAVDETQPVREDILGRLILGEASVTGNVAIDLIPDPNQAHLSLQLLGNVDSETYTKQGRITAFAGGAADIEARRSVFVNTSGLFATDAYGAAYLESRFDGVSSRCKLIQKIARKQYEKDKTLTEGISAGRLETKTLDSFLEQTNDVLLEGQQRIDNFQTQRAQNLAVLPELFLSTTPERFHITGIKSSANDLGAPVPAKPISEKTPAIAVRVNETALSNYASPILAGKALWNYEIADRLETLLSVDMSTLRDGENGDWQMLFSDKRPVQFEFDNDKFSVVVTGLRFRQGQNSINYGLTIRLNFKITRVDGELFLERDGKPQVDYLTDQKDGKTVAFKTALERQLDKGNADGSPTEIPLPENLLPVDEDLLKDVPLAKRLKLVELRSVDGWLYLGWNYVGEGEIYEGPVNTPAIWNN